MAIHGPHWHIAGVDIEARQWPTLLELAALMPSRLLRLWLVSPHVPQHLSGQVHTFASPNLTCCGQQGCSCEDGQQAAHASRHAQGNSAQCAIAQQPAQATAALASAASSPQGSIELHWAQGLYHDAWHELSEDMQHPTIILGLNAGTANICPACKQTMTFDTAASEKELL